MLDENELYVIETDGSIHEMNFVGDSDWDTKPTTSLKEIRNNIIDEFAKRIIELVDEFPTVEDEFGELRPMTINEMCNVIAEQMKGV